VDAQAWDERYAGSELVWSATPNRFVVEQLAGLPPGRALDLACGEGRNALWLADRGWMVDALDFSSVALDKGRALVRQHPRAAELRVRWVHGDALTHTLTGPYDLVLLAYLQLPPEQRRTAVRRSFLALAPGGTFLLVAHDATNIAEGTGGPQDPDVLATAEEVLADLDGERFEVLHADRVAREVQPDDAHRGEPTRTAWDCLVRLVRTQ
jgi:SAM-dependent methyltransferase